MVEQFIIKNIMSYSYLEYNKFYIYVLFDINDID